MPEFVSFPNASPRQSPWDAFADIGAAVLSKREQMTAEQETKKRQAEQDAWDKQKAFLSLIQAGAQKSGIRAAKSGEKPDFVANGTGYMLGDSDTKAKKLPSQSEIEAIYTSRGIMTPSQVWAGLSQVIDPKQKKQLYDEQLSSSEYKAARQQAMSLYGDDGASSVAEAQQPFALNGALATAMQAGAGNYGVGNGSNPYDFIDQQAKNGMVDDSVLNSLTNPQGPIGPQAGRLAATLTGVGGGAALAGSAATDLARRAGFSTLMSALKYGARPAMSAVGAGASALAPIASRALPLAGTAYALDQGLNQGRITNALFNPSQQQMEAERNFISGMLRGGNAGGGWAASFPGNVPQAYQGQYPTGR